MTAEVLSALIGAIGTAVGAGVSVGGTAIKNKQNLKYSKQFAQYTNQLNMGNWLIQQAYNTPENQMQRYQDAGLNPNLMYGQGSSGNASSVPETHASAPQMENYFKDFNLAQMYESLKGQALDNESRKTDVDLKRLEYERDAIDLQQETQDWNARQAFIADKTGVSDEEFSSWTIGTGDSSGIYRKQLQNTSMYKELEILWKKGILTDENIGLVKSRKDLNEYQNWFNQGAKDLLNDDAKFGAAGKFVLYLLKTFLSK